jgi:cyclophilin family peptidyl-prolyl cis-trans isomerase
MKRQVALILTLLLSVSPVLTADDDAAAPTKSGPRAEEFRKVHQKMNLLLADLLELRVKYRTASEDQRSDIQLQWNEKIAEGKTLEPQLIEAAEKAYAEAPNTDPQLAVFLIVLLDEAVQADEYELAAKIGKLLMDNNCPEKGIANLAGIAAFEVSDFAAAEKYFNVAAKQGRYQSVAKNDKLAQRGLYCRARVGDYKKIWAAEKAIRDREAKEDYLPRVRLKTTKGDIDLELFEDQAPNTVANFISLVERGFYKDMPFYHVVQGLFALTGDPTGSGFGGPGYSIPCECYEPNHRNHFRGSVSMANSGRDTGGSQFFITFVPIEDLDGKKTVFGRVIKGMDVLAKLQRRDPTDKEAARADRISEAEVTWKRPHEYKPQIMPD